MIHFVQNVKMDLIFILMNVKDVQKIVLKKMVIIQ